MRYYRADVVGLHHRRKQLANLEPLPTGETLYFYREPDNLHDRHAILVTLRPDSNSSAQLGYLPRPLAEVLAAPMDSGLIDSLSLQIGGDVNPEMLRVLATLLKPPNKAAAKKKGGRPMGEVSIMLCVRLRGGSDAREKAALWRELDRVA